MRTLRTICGFNLRIHKRSKKYETAIYKILNIGCEPQDGIEMINECKQKREDSCK